MDVYDTTAPSLYRTSWAVQAVGSEGLPEVVERTRLADFFYGAILEPQMISASEPYSELAAIRLAWGGLRALGDRRSSYAVDALQQYEADGRYAETPGDEPTTYATFLAAEILRGEGSPVPHRVSELILSELPRVIPRISIAQMPDGLLVDLRAAALADPDALAVAHPEIGSRVSMWMAEVIGDGFGIAQLSTLMDLRALASVVPGDDITLPAGYVEGTLEAIDSGAGGVDPHVAALLHQLDPASEALRAVLDLSVGATARGWLGATTPPDVASNLRGLILLQLCDATDTAAGTSAEEYLNAHLAAASEWTTLESYAAARLEYAGSLSAELRAVAAERVRASVPNTLQDRALRGWAAKQFAVADEAVAEESAPRMGAPQTIVDLSADAIIGDREVGNEELTPFTHDDGYSYERSGEISDLYSTALGACLSRSTDTDRRSLLAAFEDAPYPGHYRLTAQSRPSLASAALAATLLFADDCTMALAVYG